jgi:flagellar hook assembly protein FlgD
LQISGGIDLWGTYLYSVWADNRTAGNGFDIYFNTVNFKETAAEDADEETDLPEQFALYQNHPNPFNPNTRMKFTVRGGNSPLFASVRIYNIRGQLVKILVEEEKPPGDHEVIWNGTNDEGEGVASGIYFYRLEIEEQTFTRKMLLLK